MNRAPESLHPPDPKPAKKRYMRITYQVVVEVDDGDFDAAKSAEQAIQSVADEVEFKRSRVVLR